MYASSSDKETLNPAGYNTIYERDPNKLPLKDEIMMGPLDKYEKYSK